MKKEMCLAALRAYQNRIQSGDGGNLSVRLPGADRILIKSSGSSFADLTEKDIVEVDFEGKVVDGSSARPSRELFSHLAIYKQRGDVHAIFHSHSPWSVACSLKHDQWPPVSLPLDMKMGPVPVLDAGNGHADQDVVKAIKRILEEWPEVKAFVQKRHGIFSLAENILKAEHNAELVEEAAQIAILTGLA